MFAAFLDLVVVFHLAIVESFPCGCFLKLAGWLDFAVELLQRMLTGVVFTTLAISFVIAD